MTISIWRYSHLTLAISSSLFILIAAITGIILAFEPISNQLTPYAIKNLKTQSLSKTIAVLDSQYEEIISLKIDDNRFVETSVITHSGENKTFYINPFTGGKIGEIIDKKPLYKWATNLHRSLFLKSTGRFIVGFFSLLLALITITGSILIIKRQGGIKRFFSEIIKENVEQYYHIIIGRLTFIPLIIITLTGVYLSLEKFSLLPDSKTTHNYSVAKPNDTKILATNLPLFKSINLNEVKSLEFPFSEDEEDYFFLKTQNKEFIIHQYSGGTISQQNVSFVAILSNWSLFLHTGKGSIIWSIVLMLSCFALLFFMYSGFAISLKRRKQNSINKNKFDKDNAEFIILVGSETGSTNLFANSLYKALLDAKKTVYINHLNSFSTYKNAKNLIILTATYGDGEPPINATKFLERLKENTLNNSINYSVVGFGSLAYSQFCQFAVEINTELQNYSNCNSILPICKINNQSFADFKSWGIQFSNATGIELKLKQETQKLKKQETFTVVHKSEHNNDNTYLIRLKPTKKTTFNSGDLLSIIPKEDNIERLYSIGKIDDDILLSIKKHEFGVCSNLIFHLKKGEKLNAKIRSNKEFYFPKKKKETILIANGTGIAPFLGMLNNTTTHLFFGIRTKASLNLYKPHLKNIEKQKIHIAYSKENTPKYVQDLIAKKENLIATTLKNGGVIMICGSVVMMNKVMFIIEKITLQKLNTPLSKFKKTKQIKTDCY
ncbi:PepSY domain-containing protein [Mesoflavibacter zeaxanthinifaciens]|uniref:PepSY domain-containing protein n=1 Tax=Mesoflavibacter zeaxanthinifaciens TaxID=393060 RepID=UPI003A90CDC5